MAGMLCTSVAHIQYLLADRVTHFQCLTVSRVRKRANKSHRDTRRQRRNQLVRQVRWYILLVHHERYTVQSRCQSRRYCYVSSTCEDCVRREPSHNANSLCHTQRNASDTSDRLPRDVAPQFARLDHSESKSRRGCQFGLQAVVAAEI